MTHAPDSSPALVIAQLYFTFAVDVCHLFITLVANGLASEFILSSLDASMPILVRQDRAGPLGSRRFCGQST